MRDRNQSVLSEVLPPEERVIEAVVARYQRVAPAVTRFARTLSGNDQLTVRLGSQAAASDDDIVIDPGVFQAAYSRAAPVTPTEVALASALHEAVHLVATNFEERRPIPASWLPERPDTVEVDDDSAIGSPLDLFADGPDVDVPGIDIGEDWTAEAADDAPGETAVALLDALAEAGGPAAIAMFLSLEDARQELVYFTGYPGARSVLADLYQAALTSAMREARPLGQFALACFLVAGDYATKDTLQRHLSSHVAAALDDAVAYLDRVKEAEDPWEVGSHALDLLAIARLNNLLTDAGISENASNRKLQQDIDEAAIAEGVDAVRMMTPVLQSAESYDRTRQAQSVAAQQGRKGDTEQAGDPATDQLVRVSESPTVYLPTGQSGKLVVSPIPDRFRNFSKDGRDLLVERATRWNVVQRRVSGELYPLFLANQRRGLRSGYDAGDLSPYAALLLGAGLYERMFERRDLPTRRSYGLSLLVDGSASMLQPRPLENDRKTPWALAAAILGAWTLAHLCDELQIDFEVALFNRAFPASIDDSEQSYSDRRHQATGGLRRSQGGAAERLTRTVNHYLIKPFDVRWRNAEDTLAGLFWMAATPQDAAREARRDPKAAPPISMFDKAANVDEFNVSYAAKRLSSRNVSTRILVVLADGMTRGSIQDLADSVSAVEQTGAIVLGIGIGDQTVRAAYSRSQVVERPEELAGAMVEGVRSTLLKTLAAMGGNTWWAHSSERVQYDPSIPRSKTNA